MSNLLLLTLNIQLLTDNTLRKNSKSKCVAINYRLLAFGFWLTYSELFFWETQRSVSDLDILVSYSDLRILRSASYVDTLELGFWLKHSALGFWLRHSALGFWFRHSVFVTMHDVNQDVNIVLIITPIQFHTEMSFKCNELHGVPVICDVNFLF